MNHKEEAIKRVEEMLYKSPTIQDGISAIDALYAKQCALLAINREIELLDKIYNNIFGDAPSEVLLIVNEKKQKLTKVKKEIELL